MGKSTRRAFLRNSAAAAGAAFALPYIIPRSARAADQKLRAAVIGVGGMGGYAVDLALSETFAFACDVDDSKVAEALKRASDVAPNAPAPKTYVDYRTMLDECQAEIDVVLISTPDHHHAPAAIRAIRMGKPVFVQKPLAHDIRECYELAAAAKRDNVLTQMGNQGHCGESFRRACECLQAGAVGNVTETHTILGRDFGGTGGRPESKPVPEGLHWEEWLGPAPYRDYHEGLHPFSWRSWRDFGTGTIGDMACHNVDCLYFGLKVNEARTFSVECLATNGGSTEMWAQGNVVRYDIPARAGMPALKAYVYDHAGLKSDTMKEVEKQFGFEMGEDTIYMGDKGVYRTTGHAGEAMIMTPERKAEFVEPPQTMPRAHGGGPIEDLYYCIKNGGTPASNFVDAATPLTAFVLAGHLAQYAGVGRVVEWDVDRMACTNMPELNEHVQRVARPGWEV
jgi:predicted dehydrogenase